MNEPTKTINEFGDIEYTLNGVLHRTDGPALEWANGYKEWYVNGERHRTDGPAIEYADGTKAWYINGFLHRTDGPATEWPNGTKAWWINNECITMGNYQDFMKQYSDLINQFLAYWVLNG